MSVAICSWLLKEWAKSSHWFTLAFPSGPDLFSEFWCVVFCLWPNPQSELTALAQAMELMNCKEHEKVISHLAFHAISWVRENVLLQVLTLASIYLFPETQLSETLQNLETQMLLRTKSRTKKRTFDFFNAMASTTLGDLAQRVNWWVPNWILWASWWCHLLHFIWPYRWSVTQCDHHPFPASAIGGVQNQSQMKPLDLWVWLVHPQVCCSQRSKWIIVSCRSQKTDRYHDQPFSRAAHDPTASDFYSFALRAALASLFGLNVDFSELFLNLFRTILNYFIFGQNYFIFWPGPLVHILSGLVHILSAFVVNLLFAVFHICLELPRTLQNDAFHIFWTASVACRNWARVKDYCILTRATKLNNFVHSEL